MLRRMTRIGMLTLLLVGLALSQAACGKKGNLKPPQDKPSNYPRSYPTS